MASPDLLSLAVACSGYSYEQGEAFFFFSFYNHPQESNTLMPLPAARGASRGAHIGCPSSTVPLLTEK